MLHSIHELFLNQVNVLSLILSQNYHKTIVVIFILDQNSTINNYFDIHKMLNAEICNNSNLIHLINIISLLSYYLHYLSLNKYLP